MLKTLPPIIEIVSLNQVINSSCLNYKTLSKQKYLFFLFFVCFVFVFFAISWAAPVAYGGSQARGQIGAVAASLHQSHSNTRSEPHLQPTPQLTETPDPLPTEQGQGPNLQPHGS